MRAVATKCCKGASLSAFCMIVSICCEVSPVDLVADDAEHGAEVATSTFGPRTCFDYFEGGDCSTEFLDKASSNANPSIAVMARYLILLRGAPPNPSEWKTPGTFPRLLDDAAFHVPPRWAYAVGRQLYSNDPTGEIALKHTFETPLPETDEFCRFTRCIAKTSGEQMIEVTACRPFLRKEDDGYDRLLNKLNGRTMLVFPAAREWTETADGFRVPSNTALVFARRESAEIEVRNREGQAVVFSLPTSWLEQLRKSGDSHFVAGASDRYAYFAHPFRFGFNVQCVDRKSLFPQWRKPVWSVEPIPEAIWGSPPPMHSIEMSFPRQEVMDGSTVAIFQHAESFACMDMLSEHSDTHFSANMWGLLPQPKLGKSRYGSHVRTH